MKKIRFLVVMLCMATLMRGFAVTANAQSDEPIIEATPAPVVTTAPTPVPTPEPVLTPPGGTGTVVEQTDEEGKEFYTIMTADENVFYLVIDRQRETENVYFLNAVTEADLLPLAELPVEKAPEPTPVPTPVPDTAPMPEIESGPDVRLLLILILAVLAIGLAFFCVKKHFAAHGNEESYEDEPEDYEEPIAEDEDFSKWFDEWEKK